MMGYDSYKDSEVEWIGEIPSHWDKVKMKFLGKIVSGDSLESSLIDKKEGVFPVYGGNGVMGFYSEYNFNKPILIIGRVGEKCGNVHYSDKKVYVNDNSLVFDSYDDRMDLWFIYHSLVQRNLNQLRNKNTQPLITGTIVKDEPIPYPPINEQQQIVKFLNVKTSLIDSLLKKTKRKIKLLKEQRTSLINELVTKGLNPNVELKDSGIEWIGEIPSHWVKTKMKHITSLNGRIGYRGYTTEDIVNEGEGVITISPGNIKNDKFNTINSTYLSWVKYFESPEIQIFTNDIILVKTGSTIGKTSIIPDGVPEMTINPQLVVLKQIKLFPRYLYYQTTCRFIKESFNVEQTGSTTPTISQEKMNEFPILHPPLKEQQGIVDFLDKKTNLIDSTISIEEKRIEHLKEYRQSLISEVVTGKIKVTD